MEETKLTVETITSLTDEFDLENQVDGEDGNFYKKD